MSGRPLRDLSGGVILLTLVVACQSRDAASRSESEATPGTSTLREVSLPTMGNADQSLQERVRNGYASLEATRERTDATAADLAAAYGAVGKLLIGAELLTQAEPYLRNAQALAPLDMAWPYYLGHVHRLRNEREAAIGFFQEAARLQPDFVPALVWLGALYLDRGDPAAAEPVLKKAVSLQPGSAAARFGLGRAALATGDYAAAKEHLEAALTADAGAKRAHYPLAMTYRALGNQRQAETHLREWERAFSPSESLKDAQVYPADPLMEEVGSLLQTAVAYELRGIRALDERRWTDAIAQFREGLKVSPRDATLHQNLGTALYLSGDERNARQAFEEAVRLSPGYARAHFSLGVLVEAAGNDQEALERFTAALKYDPTFVDARFRLADGLRRVGRVEASLPHYRDILAADPKASQARFGYAMGLVRLRRYAEARAALEEAARLHPEQPGFAHALARLLAAAPDDQVRDGRRAIALLAALEKTYGATPALSETTAMAMAEVGKFSEAAARQREAIAAATRLGRNDLVRQMAENLRRYETNTPCRVPWPDDDPVLVPPRTSGLRF